MKIADAFHRYTAEVAFVHAYQTTIRKAADEELKALLEQDNKRKEFGMLRDDIFAMGNHFFRTADTGQPYFYAFKDYTIQDQIDALVQRTNRQYQWLLAEVYEFFEDFLEDIYACAAIANKNIWPLRDYGSITLDEIDAIGYDYLFEQSRQKREKPRSILNPLRNKLPRIKLLETRNKLQVDLWLTINFIEKLRHHIVHTKGVISDKDKFITEVLNSVGLSNNGKPKQEHLDLLNKYFQPEDGKYIIYLLEHQLSPCGPARRYSDVFKYLTDCLLAYAHIVVTCFTALKSKQPENKDGS